MWYAIIATDRAASLEQRRLTRPAHLERLKELVAEGRLLVAGPHPAIDAEDAGAAGFTGSLMLVDFPDLDAAKAWAQSDPYVAAGVFESVIVKPFCQVLP